MQWPPAYMQGLAGATYGMWDSSTPGLTLSGQVQPGEGGVDIGVPNGVPVYALASGPLIAAGYWKDSGHGVVTQRVNVPGVGIEDLYYQHIQLDPSIQQCQGNCNQYIQKGQLIGVIGPYNEIEMGFNSLWGGVWGDNHPGPWIRDPRPWLEALLTGNAPPVAALLADTTGTITSDVGSVIAALQPLWDWLSNPARVGKLIGGLLCITIALLMLVAPDAINTIKNNPELLLA